MFSYIDYVIKKLNNAKYNGINHANQFDNMSPEEAHYRSGFGGSESCCLSSGA
jgi:hypothetical protein